VRLKTVSSQPARARFAAIREPMIPRPTKPMRSGAAIGPMLEDETMTITVVAFVPGESPDDVLQFDTIRLLTHQQPG